ncbi:DUF2304 domain-containing protein [Patescibacteria group bacterium]|nr:DUF2304 domain-containing protein [Patescibacteria group bacterium]
MFYGIPNFQIVAVIGSILFILVLIELVRSRRLKEHYSLLWFGIAIIFFLFSIWKDLLVFVAFVLGISYEPAAIFLILISGLYLLSIHFSIVISGFSEKNKNLSQEIGLLKEEMKSLKERMQKGKGV